MAVDSLELRPRTSVALLDAAVRLCGRALGVWSIVLPAGAVLTWALFEFVETARMHRSMTWPSIWLAVAWLLRCVAQAAASHHLEQTVLGAGEPDTWSSWARALGRLPSLCVVCAHNLVLNLTLVALTGGLGLLFLSAHTAGYAVALRGEGHPLATYFTCSRLLGPSRHSAGWVRIAGLSQLLVAFNLHLGISLLFKAITTLVAIDVTFADRFASIDNPVWLAALAAITFTLFEPLRAACATLLLVDGRVRQEGLDLLAAVEQLPLRRSARKSSPVVGAALLVALLGWPAQAEPGDDWKGVYFPGASSPEGSAGESTLAQRLGALSDECGLEAGAVPTGALEGLAALPQSEQASLARLVTRLEQRAYDQEDCEGALAELKRGLQLAAATVPEGDAEGAREDAKKILARPEFDRPEAVDKEKDNDPEKDPDKEPPGWLAKFWDDLVKALLEWLRANRRTPIERRESTPAFDLGLTNIVVIGAVVLVLGVLVALLVRGRSARQRPDSDAEVSGLAETALEADPMSALARPPEGWAELADALAKEGNFREAIRHLYLALLSRLHRDGAIDYDPAKSNWDYFRGFKGAREALTPFKELTQRFDFAWYGHLDVSAQAYASFRRLTHPLLSPEATGNA